MDVRKFNTVYPVNTKINGDKLHGDEWTALSQAAHDVQTKVNEIIDAISSEQHGETSSVLTPQMFGAVGGSSFDVANAAADTAAFKALANAVSTEGGEKRVYIPAGHYVLNERVDFVDSCYVYGDGENTVIDCINGAGGITFGYKNDSYTGSCTQLTNTITADAAKGDSVITLNSVSNLAVGMYLIVSNTEDYSFNLSRPYFRTSEVVKVAAIDGNAVTLAGVLAGKYFVGRTVISAFEPQSFVVKDLKIVSHEASSYSTYYTFCACGIADSVFENVVVDNYGNHTAGLIAYGVNYKVEHCTFKNHVDNNSLYDVYGLVIQSGQDFVVSDSTFKGAEGRGEGGNTKHCHGLATGSTDSVFAFNNRYFVYQRLHFDASQIGAIDLDVHGCSEDYKFVDIYAPHVACDTGGYNVTIEGCTFDRITNTFNCDGVRIVNCEIMNYTNTGKILWSDSQAIAERKFGNFVFLNNRIHGAYWIDFQKATNNQGKHDITNFVFCGNFVDFLRLDHGYIGNIVVDGNTFTDGGFAAYAVSMDSVVVRNNTFVNGCLHVTSTNVRAFCDISNNVINHVTATARLQDDYTVMAQNVDGVIKGNSIKRALAGRRPVFLIGIGSDIKVEDNYIHAAVVGRELFYLRGDSRVVFVGNTYNSTSLKDSQGIVVEEDGAKFGVKRIGTRAERPVGGDIYVGFKYIDTDEGKAVFAVAIDGDDVTWATWGNEAVTPVDPEPEPEPVPVTGFTISGPSNIDGTGVRTYHITDVAPSNYTVGIQSIAVTSDSGFDINVVSASEFNIDVNSTSETAYTINITVAATLANGTVVTETKTVDVAASVPEQIPVTGFSISGPTDINEAGSYNYTITDVVPGNANVGISSLVVNGNIPSSDVTTNGFTLNVVDIPIGTQVTETITVKAILANNAEITRSIDITLTGAEAVPVTDFSILGEDTISESGTYHYTIGNVIPSEPNVGIKRLDVTSTTGTVDSNGSTSGFDLTVQQDSVAVTATITVVATLDDDSTLTRTKTVTIEAAVIPATDFSISGPDMIDSIGDAQFNVVASPANANVGFKSVAVDAGTLDSTVGASDQNGDTPFNVTVNNLDGTVEVPVGVTATLNDDSEVEHTKTVKLRQPAPAVSTVDLGLASGNLWATANIGAANPEDRGYYFTWGNTDGYTATNMQEITNDSYANTPGNWQGFRIEPIQDAARSYLGSEYLIPTKEDYQELIAGCDWVADTINGVNVWKGTSKSNGSVIIFPRAGMLGDGGVMQYYNTNGYYFSSNSADVAGKSAIRINVDNNGLRQYSKGNKYNTASLRAIKRSTPVAVDLGLPSGKLWSDRNVGVINSTGNGQYCSYGNILGHYEDLSSNTNLREVYADTAGGELTSSFTSGDAAHDIVKAVCGGNWRMPTIQEWQELLNAENTTTEWTTVDDVNGLRITSKANGNSIFLPASGRIAAGGKLSGFGEFGTYASSSMHSNGSAQYCVYFANGSLNVQATNSRTMCISVRGIINAE